MAKNTATITVGIKPDGTFEQMAEAMHGLSILFACLAGDFQKACEQLRKDLRAFQKQHEQLSRWQRFVWWLKDLHYDAQALVLSIRLRFNKKHQDWVARRNTWASGGVIPNSYVGSEMPAKGGGYDELE